MKVFETCCNSLQCCPLLSKIPLIIIISWSQSADKNVIHSVILVKTKTLYLLLKDFKIVFLLAQMLKLSALYCVWTLEELEKRSVCVSSSHGVSRKQENLLMSWHNCWANQRVAEGRQSMHSLQRETSYCLALRESGFNLRNVWKGRIFICCGDSKLA